MGEMIQSEHIRCPGCSGNMIFSIRQQKLVCESCGKTSTIQEYENIVAEKNRKGVKDAFTSGARACNDNEKNPLNRYYTCSSCGGQIYLGVLSATAKCPFCGNDIIMTDKYRAQKMPDFLIPFQKDQENFREKIIEKAMERTMVPDAFIEKLKSAKYVPSYIPFWVCDAEISGSLDYEVETITPWPISLTGREKMNYFHFVRECHARGSIRISGIPQDACDSLDDKLTQPLEPFNTNAAVPFSPAWLSGLDAKIYDVDSEHGLYQILKRMHTSFDVFLTNAKKYDFFAGSEQNYRLVHHRMLYALFPVWTAEVEWESNKKNTNYWEREENKKFIFSMNGQTGKCVGSFPVCTKKINICAVSCWFLYLSFCYLWLTQSLFFPETTTLPPVLNHPYFIAATLFPAWFFINRTAAKCFFKTEGTSYFYGTLFMLLGILFLALTAIVTPSNLIYILSPMVLIPFLILSKATSEFMPQRLQKITDLKLVRQGDDYIIPGNSRVYERKVKHRHLCLRSHKHTTLRFGISTKDLYK